jgi:Cu+-exporting ATPase
MKKEKYTVTGMTCSACSSRVEKAVSSLKGMEKASVNLLTNSMQVEYDDSILSSSDIVNAVVNAGYGIGGSDATSSSAKLEKNNEKDEMLHRLVYSFVFLLFLMSISMSHMIAKTGFPIPQWFQNIFWGNENAITFAFAQFLIVLPILYLNRIYYIRGYKNLFHLSPNMDTLIAVGSSASMFYGIFALFRMSWGLGHGNMDLVGTYSMDLYFESAGMIVTLITLGKYLESRSKKKTSKAIEKLVALAPKEAEIERNGQVMTVPVEQLVVGDIVIIRPGESIAVDGVIVEGSTSVDQSAITGESIPVEKQVGDNVVSASINKNGFIKIRAVKVGENSTINQIIKLVEEASSSKAPIARMADKIAGIFVPVVMTIALVTIIVWLISGASFEFALSAGITVLVISCPCSLGLATPVAIMVGTGKGAENGILIKSGEALETAHKIDTVVMDKTGTITEGKPKVTDIVEYIDKNSLLTYAISLEKNSEHPLAEAIVKYCKDNNISSESVENFEAVFGKGVKATSGNSTILGGNRAFMKENNIDISKIEPQINSLADEGKTPLIFAKDNNVIGIIAVADVEKETSRKAIEEFTKMGISTVMLTGDNERTAKAIQKRLNIPKVIAQVLPEDKEKEIRRLQDEGHCVAMIGDGINDAPALAKADVGIAIGADVAIESADAVLVRNDLLDAVSAVKLSKAVIKNIKENLFWAFFYNCIGIPVAAGVLYPIWGIKLSPMFGAAAMSLSSICVVTNALRLRRFKTYKSSGKVEETVIEVKKENEKMKKVLSIEGMMCGHCQAHVEKALKAMDGVTSVEVSLENKNATVELSKDISDAEFKAVIEDAGYELKSVQ